MSRRPSSADAPFIPDRLAALRGWVKSGRFAELLNRSDAKTAPRLLTIETIVLRNVAPEGSKVYPYVVAKHEPRKELFKTKVGPAGPDVFWENINDSSSTTEGRPIFFEIWESR